MKKEQIRFSHELGVKVDYATFTDKESGKILVAYLQEPNIIASAQALDLLTMGKVFEAGQRLFPAVFLPNESDKELEANKYKLGLFAIIGKMVDAIAPDVKKS
jgi:hypothetical protein